ncbi:hypothetical protein E2C01_097342 [Portunus trituberculatus]|uniref:Secreted protein n=1 Tax=Portunus trituberculatus TaxID=210409 RepID=A0A5B7K5G1_PORTR|nr:hypothetical protein [Portunus trituberculatus]
MCCWLSSVSWLPGAVTLTTQSPSLKGKIRRRGEGKVYRVRNVSLSRPDVPPLWTSLPTLPHCVLCLSTHD